MNLESPPEMADGGYWYVVEVVVDPVLGGKTPGVNLGVGFCAWYSGNLVVVRTVAPVSTLPSVTKVSDVLTTNKPYGRVGGI